MHMPRTPAAKIAEILRLASRIHFQLGPAAKTWYGLGAHASGDAALLKNLAELGPKTVPELAAMRPTSRQFIQGLVDGLAARDLVEFQDNPRHRRSKLVVLTTKGRALNVKLLARREQAMDLLANGQDAKALATCVAELTNILDKLEQA